MHEVLVNRLGGLSLPRKSVVRLTDRPDMTLDVYRGRKATKQHSNQMFVLLAFGWHGQSRLQECDFTLWVRVPYVMDFLTSNWCAWTQQYFFFKSKRLSRLFLLFLNTC